MIIIIIDKVLSPGGSLRLLAASMPGLGKLLVDEEDLQLVRIRMRMMMMMKMVRIRMRMMGMMGMMKLVRIMMIMMFALLHCPEMDNIL